MKLKTSALISVMSVSGFINLFSQNINNSNTARQQEISAPEVKQTPLICIETNNTALVLKAGNDKMLYQTYLGSKLINAADYEEVSKENTKKFVINDGNPLIDLRHKAYPVFGTDNLFQPALRMAHNNGNPSLELMYVNHDCQSLDDNIRLTTIELKDMVYPVKVKLFYKAYYKENIIEMWTEISHNEKKPVTLYNYASAALHFDADKYWLTQLYSDVVEEARIEESMLTHGTKVIDSKLGVRTSMFNVPAFFISLNGKSDETNGELIAGTLAWQGNFRLCFDLDNNNELRVVSGINEFASEYNLAPGKVFQTPSFIFTYSDNGKGTASRNLHSWARKYGLKDGQKPRFTLLNNWETTYFDFDETRLAEMFTDAKSLGVDMFLLDDGWFGNKYPRRGSTSGLGDWQPTKSIIPDGLGYLMKKSTETGVRFGIWIEPEMINEKSELYENHPDWVLSLPDRDKHYYRTQLVLDLCNPLVQDFVFKVVDDIMQTGSGVSFFKWDCNRMMASAYSNYLKNNQSHMFIEYTRGLVNVLERIKAKYPYLPMMLCAGGGGRIDYGFLKYFTEFWASDNTDPYNRVFIQWGFSHFFPSVATCCHVTSMGKQSIKFRTEVAMMGKLGFDINVKHLRDYELDYCRLAISNYKRLNNIIWQGDQYRLISPYDETRAVLMYVNPEKDKSVLFSYTLHPLQDPNYSRVKLQGLDPYKSYKVVEINVSQGFRPVFEDSGKFFTGDFLMKVGLNVSSPNPETSVVLELTAV